MIYNLRSDHRDFQPYPTKGWAFTGELRVNGLLPSDNFRLSRLYVQYARYFQVGKKSSFEAIAAGRVSFPRRKPPYFNNQALGYANNLVRGYQYYVSDGLDYVLLKNSLRLQVFDNCCTLANGCLLKRLKPCPCGSCS